jgi:hypothetical protein
MDAESLPSEKGGKPLGWRSFHCYLVDSEGRAYYLPCGAKGELPKSAPREMYFEGSKAFPWQPDLAGVKPKDEIAWFKRSSPRTRSLGSRRDQPEFGWGWLSWCEL